MKHLIIVLIAGIVLPFLLQAQTSDREYIISKLEVYYKPDPNNLSDTTFYAITAEEIINNEFVFGTATNNSMDNSLAFLRLLFQPAGQGGIGYLQKYVASILRLNNKIVRCLFFNDVNAGVTQEASWRYGFFISDTSVWPCARHFTSRPEAEIVSGEIMLGEQYFRRTGVFVGCNTFLHELYHTQDPSDRREHIWYVESLRQSFSYGSDDAHYNVELIPNIAATYKEAVANIFPYLYSRAEKNAVIMFFAENGMVIVEKNRPQHIPKSMWLYSLISSTNPPGPGLNPSATHWRQEIVDDYKIYRIADLPARFILHNEQLMGLVGAEYAEKVGYSKFINALQNTHAQVTQVSTNAFARLISNMCNEALPPGKSLNDVTNQTALEMPYLYPLALVDYFTYYRTQSKEEFKGLFEGLIEDGWIDLYWDTGKDIVRNTAPFQMVDGYPAGRQNTPGHINSIARVLKVYNKE